MLSWLKTFLSLSKNNNLRFFLKTDNEADVFTSSGKAFHKLTIRILNDIWSAGRPHFYVALQKRDLERLVLSYDQ